MARFNSVVRDLKALGSSAPLRAAYEASKRSGFHSVLFREVRQKGWRSRLLPLGDLIPRSQVARERCLQDATTILSQGTRVFGRRVSTGVHAPWNVDPLTGQEWPAKTKWWQIDIRTSERMSDVKWVWEIGRHRDLVILARASAIEPEGVWLAELEAMLRSWLDQCPPERGVNWYSSLELALRAISWAQMLALVGDRLPDDLRAGLDAQLVASARHIMIELPYTVSSMKNNHLLGDGLGLVVLGRMFPDHPGAERWQKIGDVLFLKQLSRHMRADGSMIEDSLSYHRFVMEMLIVRKLIGNVPRPIEEALSGAAEHLRQLGVLESEVPQYGDWDEGRVLADSMPAGSVRGATYAALAIVGYTIPAEAWADSDEVAWYVAPRGDQGRALPQLRPVRSSGDFQIVERGPWKVWFKVAGSRSHQHADISAVWIMREDQWLLKDPGTGTYNGPLKVRNGFRTSTAHPVWCPVGLDQLQPHRAFRWLRSVSGGAVEPAATGDRVVLFAWHDAFVLDGKGTRLSRAVVVTNDGVTIRDFVENPDSYQSWSLTLPLASETVSHSLVGLDGASPQRGITDPFAGWTSDTYGHWERATWMTLRAKTPECLWGAGSLSAALHHATVQWVSRPTLHLARTNSGRE